MTPERLTLLFVFLFLTFVLAIHAKDKNVK